MREPRQHRSIGRVGEHVGDAVIGQRRAEQQRAIDQFAPEIAPDIAGQDRVRLELQHQRIDCLDAWRRLAVEFADDDRAVTAIVHHARLQIVGAEIDEAADDMLLADNVGDDVLIEAVLGRDDVAVSGEMRLAALWPRPRCDAL